MTGIKISELSEITEVSDGDYLHIRTSGGYDNKITHANYKTQFNPIVVSDYAEMLALTPANFSVGDVVYVTDEGIAGMFVVTTGSATDDGGVVKTNSTWNTASKHFKRTFNYPVSVMDFEAAGDGATNDSDELTTAIDFGGSVKLESFEYLSSTSSADLGLASPQDLIGCGLSTKLLLSGNSRTAFGFSDNDKTLRNLSIDGQKPTVGWETTNNYDFGLRMGAQSGSVKGNYFVDNVYCKDLGLDGITITNTDMASIGNSHFENCRRTSISVIDGDSGTSNIRIHDIIIDCDFGGGPIGKEYPLFAIDIEPDGASVNGVKRVSLDGFHAHMGRVSSYRPASAVLEDACIRNGLISGTRGQLSSTNDKTIWSNIHLCEGAILNIDTDDETAITKPFLSDITINRDDEVFNSDGRNNILPADFIHIDDGTQSLSGTGVITTQTVAVDGILTRVSEFEIATGTGVAAANIQCSATVTTGDNVIIIMLVDRTDVNSNDDPVFRVNLATGGNEVLDRTYSMPTGTNQWVTVAVESEVTAVNPTLLVGLSGTVSADVSIRIKKCFIFVNPTSIDYPSLKIGYRQAAKTFTGTLTGCTTSPTGTLRWTQEGSRVMLEFPALYATSNSSTATITGMPESIWPAQAQTVMMVMTRDNGVDVVSGCLVATNGVITLFKGASDNTFTTSGSKGVSECTIFYSLI